MEAEESQGALLCPRCRSAVDATDNYCRRCGARLGAFGAARKAWWDNPWFILAMLFLIAGPFGLPLLWMSRRFSLAWKIILTALTLVHTVYFSWQVWCLVQKLSKALEGGLRGL